MTNIFERQIAKPVCYHGRLSTIETDVGFENFQRVYPGHRIDVFLNGVEIKDVTIADPVEGFVVHAKLNKHGKIYCEGNTVVQETLRGAIEIRLSKK